MIEGRYDMRNRVIVFVFAMAMLAGVLFVSESMGGQTNAPGPTGSWSTKDGYAWNGKKWFKPWHGVPHYPARPLGTRGLWCDGVPYDSPLSRRIQQWEREAAEAPKK